MTRPCPAFLKKEKLVNQVPVNALWLTNVMIQLFLVITLFSHSTYTLIYLASSMILVPYLWSAAYAVLLSGRGRNYEGAPHHRIKDLLIGNRWAMPCGCSRRGLEIPAALGVAVCPWGDSVRAGPSVGKTSHSRPSWKKAFSAA